MGEHKPTFHSQNKMLQTPYDWILEQEGECTVCLTNAHIQMIFSVVDYFGWATRWSRAEGEIDQETIDALKDDLVRRLMAGCQGQEPQETRYTDDGVFQVKDHVTEEWVDSPEQDPRLSTPEPPRLTGTPGDALRCAAADNIRDYYKQTRDELLSLLAGSAIVTAIVSGLLGLLAVVLFSTIVGAALAVIIWSMAAAAFTLGHDSVEDQLTDEVMEQFKCLVYNHLNTSGEIDYDGWQELITDIDATFEDFPETFFHAWTAAIGYRGLIAAGAAGTNTASDCDECAGCEPIVINGSVGGWEAFVAGSDLSLYDWEGAVPIYNLTTTPPIYYIAAGYGVTSPNQYLCIRHTYAEPCFVDTIAVGVDGRPAASRIIFYKKVDGVWSIVLNSVGVNTSSISLTADVGDVVEALQVEFFTQNYAIINAVSVG